jgi:predicted amidohydrolase YtcJ
LLLALLIGGCTRAPDQDADLIVFNARVSTMDTARTMVSAVAVADGRILRVGGDEEALGLRGPHTQVVDAGGRRLIPGLNDSHLHAVRGGRFYNLELRWDGATTLTRALDMVREQAERTPDGQWVRVIGGWSPHQFEEGRMPTTEELNRVAPNTPVAVLFLYSQGFLNRAAIDALGIDGDTLPPVGSRFERGADGRPTGVLLAEPNPTILYQTIGALPPMSLEEQVNSTRHFFRELNRFGLTSAIDAGGGGHVFPENYEATKTLAERGELPLRISFYLFPQRPGREFEDFEEWMSSNDVDQNGARALPDGYTLEGAGEFLVWSAGDFENFLAPRPELAERENWSQELERVTRLLVQNRWPFRIHATYGESISQILDVFERIDEELAFNGLRWALDHAETISRSDIERVKALGGGIAVQDRMAFAGEYFRDRYGEAAAATTPPLRELIESGVPLGVGTDGTRVSSYNPWLSLYWMVSGRTVGGTLLYGPENTLTREEALRLYTVGSAWFSGEEGVKGMLSQGRYADMSLLSADYFEVAEEDIRHIESVLTIVGGEVVYGAEEFATLAQPLPPVSPEWSPVARFGGYQQSQRGR